MLCFWTTRGAAVFDLWMTLELLLSGRLVPLPLMPDWVQDVVPVPAVPVGVLLPDRERSSATSRRGAARGLAVQLLWILDRRSRSSRSRGSYAIRRYSAVGG